MPKPKPAGKLVFSVTIKDCDVQTKRGSGNGGQNRNVRDTAVRIVHRASGAVGEASEERSQLLNKRKAFERMAKTAVFRGWLALAVDDGPTAEERVAVDMASQNIRTEVKVDGKWTVASIDPS